MVLYRLFGRNQEIIGFDSGFLNQFAFGINHQAFQVGTLDNVQIFPGLLSIRALRADRLVNRHGVNDRFDKIQFRQTVGLQFQAGFFTESIMAGQNRAFDAHKDIAHELSIAQGKSLKHWDLSVPSLVGKPDASCFKINLNEKT
jgi:hypothetical protein